MTVLGVASGSHEWPVHDTPSTRVVPLPARASTYIQGAVEMAAHGGVTEILLAVGRGGFAAAVAAGARIPFLALAASTAAVEVPLRDCEVDE